MSVPWGRCDFERGNFPKNRGWKAHSGEDQGLSVTTSPIRLRLGPFSWMSCTIFGVRPCEGPYSWMRKRHPPGCPFPRKKQPQKGCFWSGKRDSNSRPRPWQGRALPTELFPPFLQKFRKIHPTFGESGLQRYNYYLNLQILFNFFRYLYCVGVRPAHLQFPVRA